MVYIKRDKETCRGAETMPKQAGYYRLRRVSIFYTYEEQCVVGRAKVWLRLLSTGRSATVAILTSYKQIVTVFEFITYQALARDSWAVAMLALALVHDYNTGTSLHVSLCCTA
jgi:hypothetical protein